MLRVDGNGEYILSKDSCICLVSGHRNCTRISGVVIIPFYEMITVISCCGYFYLVKIQCRFAACSRSPFGICRGGWNSISILCKLCRKRGIACQNNSTRIVGITIWPLREMITIIRCGSTCYCCWYITNSVRFGTCCRDCAIFCICCYCIREWSSIDFWCDAWPRRFVSIYCPTRYINS